MKKPWKTLGLFYFICLLCTWCDVHFRLSPGGALSHTAHGLFWGGSFMYILAKYRTRLLEFMKKGMTRLEELNRMVGTNRPMNAVASAGLWGAFILVAACIMLPLGVAFHLLEVENLFPHPLTALSLIMIVLYLIPSLLWWIHRGLFKSTRFIPYDPIAPEKVIALDKTTPPIRERYMLFIVGSIIRVSLIVQTAIHSRPFYQVLYEVEGAYPLLYCFPYECGGYAYIPEPPVLYIVRPRKMTALFQKVISAANPHGREAVCWGRRPLAVVSSPEH